MQPEGSMSSILLQLERCGFFTSPVNAVIQTSEYQEAFQVIPKLQLQEGRKQASQFSHSSVVMCDLLCLPPGTAKDVTTLMWSMCGTHASCHIFPGCSCSHVCQYPHPHICLGPLCILIHQDMLQVQQGQDSASLALAYNT